MNPLTSLRWIITDCLISLLICVAPGDEKGEQLLNAVYAWQRRFEKTEENYDR